MYKTTICNDRDQVCKFLENMVKLGYNPKMQVITITVEPAMFGYQYVIFYEYFEDLGEPKQKENLNKINDYKNYMQKFLFYLVFICCIFSSCSNDNDIIDNKNLNDTCLIKTFFEDIYPKYNYLNYELKNNGKYHPMIHYTNQYYKNELIITYSSNNDIENVYHNIADILFINTKQNKYNIDSIYNDEFEANVSFKNSDNLLYIDTLQYPQYKLNNFNFFIYCNHNNQLFNFIKK